MSQAKLLYDPLGEHSVPRGRTYVCGICGAVSPRHDSGCFINRQKLIKARLENMIRELTDGTPYDPDDIIKGCNNA